MTISRERVVCLDGFSVSVQASEHHYCTPREDDEVYTHVELGYPSEAEASLAQYAERPDHLLDTVYGWVPVGVVVDLLLSHGGMISGEMPPITIPPTLSLKQQRDELLAALEGLVAAFGISRVDGAGAAWVQAIEAIENATGGEE